jgi:hypothetical protein
VGEETDYRSLVVQSLAGVFLGGRRDPRLLVEQLAKPSKRLHTEHAQMAGTRANRPAGQAMSSS